MCCKSPRFWRSPALAAVLAIVLVGCVAAAGARPAAHRSEATTNSADNSLRQSHRDYLSDPDLSIKDPKRRIICGSALNHRLGRMCGDRGFNDMQTHSDPSESTTNTVRSPRPGGAATLCCGPDRLGCTNKELDSFCKPRSLSAVPESDTQEYSQENIATSNNQLETNTVLHEKPKSVPIRTDANPDIETDNALKRDNATHTAFVCTGSIAPTFGNPKVHIAPPFGNPKGNIAPPFGNPKGKKQKAAVNCKKQYVT